MPHLVKFTYPLKAMIPDEDARRFAYLTYNSPHKDTPMMKFDLDTLISHNACEPGLQVFKVVFPNGYEGEWTAVHQAMLLNDKEARKFFSWLVSYKLIPMVSMAGVDLSNCDFSAAVIHGAEFTAANLAGADLRDADLRTCDFMGADLRGADLRKSIMYHADLDGADLRGAIVECVDFRGANLRGANLEGLDLRKTDLTGANLAGANLEGVRLPK